MSTAPALVDTAWLANHLNDENLRLFDCTVHITPEADGTFAMESGRPRFDERHIPCAGFLDVIEELSDTGSPLRFTMPAPDALAAVLGGRGVGDGSRVVLYSESMPAWATRVWWMLRAIGFDNASVLDGGLDKWTAEGRPTTAEAPSHTPATLTPRPRPDLFADKDEVAAAVGEGDVCLMNTLPAALHRGDVSIAPRPGRIAGSINLPSQDLTDPETNTFLPPDQLRERLDGVGARDGSRVITYCGGGIAATQNAFALKLIGHDDVAVYDGSLSEWAADPDAPMETG